MKKFIRWLAKVFNANIIQEKIIYKEKIVYKSIDEYKEGNMEVDGNLKINGFLSVTGDIICYKIKQEDYDSTR